LGTGLRIGRDSAGVVIGGPGDKPRPERFPKAEQRGCSAFHSAFCRFFSGIRKVFALTQRDELIEKWQEKPR
jgi:hypothetical protein